MFGTGAAANNSVSVNTGGTLNVFTSLAVFYYTGLTANQNQTPTSFGIVYTLNTAGTTYVARLQDVTNGNTLATVTLNTGTTEGFVNTTSFSNMPTAGAVIELQMERTAGTATNTVTLFTMYFEY